MEKSVTDNVSNRTVPDAQTSYSCTPRFGTFLGVFTPSVLTILGVMMYLRFGWVVGNAGLPLALLIVLMASSITFITGLSASAISTNMRVGVGGEYFMISRSLGLHLGGAIGIPLFMCRTLSLTLYVTINIAATLEKLAADPSYRPTINVPSAVSLAGAFGAAWVMFLISPLACVAAVSLELALYIYMSRRALEGSWGDARVGILNAAARLVLIKLRGLRMSARNWRPQIMLFTANPGNRVGLVRMANCTMAI